MFPAFGAATTFTVTVALAFAHGPVPGTVYMYTPAVLVPGLNVAGAGDPPKLHVPPAVGVPPSLVNRLKAASLLQTVAVADVPACGAGW